MKGVVLAGGEGTRLRHLSGGRNKHLVEVGGQPMISYPLQTLAKVGCEDVVIVTSPEAKEDIQGLVGTGDEFGVNATYAIQERPLGTANALQQAERHIHDVFPIICGDVFLDPAPPRVEEPALFWHEFELGDRHTVWVPETKQLIEKPDPALGLGKRAVVFYFYDPNVFGYIPEVKESARGELELEDLHNWHLQKYGAGVMRSLPAEPEGFFGDMGTPEGLARVEARIRQMAA